MRTPEARHGTPSGRRGRASLFGAFSSWLENALPLWKELDGGRTLAGLYEDVAGMIDGFVNALVAADNSGTLTQLGVIERARALAAPLHARAEIFEREATAIENRLTADSAVAWERLKAAPTSPVDHTLLSQLQAKLEVEDVVAREAFLREAARTGADDLLLRAALTFHAPPFQLDGARWQPLLTPKLTEDLRLAVAERLSPFGPEAWRASRASIER